MKTANTRPLIIRNGTLMSGRDEEARPNAAIVLKNGLVDAVLTADQLQSVPKDADVVDAAGNFILPGLIDGHTHLSLYHGDPPNIRFPTSAEWYTLYAASRLRHTLRAGITSISVPGGSWFVDVYLRDAIKAGLLDGPRIFCAGRTIAPYGSIGDTGPTWFPGEQQSGADHYCVLCNTPDEYIVEVRRQRKHGVDMIKLQDTEWGDSQAISRREIEAAVNEAHQLGIPVCIHARSRGSIRDSALAGVDWIFHIDFATEQELDLIAKANIPVLPAFTQGVLWSESPQTPTAVRERIKRQIDVNVASIRRARDRGIKILVGTDSGNGPPTTLGTCHGYEAAFFVKRVGFTPLEVISAHTRDNSMLVGLEGKIGTIEPGKIADVIILDRDPLKDITVLGDPDHVKTVIKDGVQIDLNALVSRSTREAGTRSLQRGTEHLIPGAGGIPLPLTEDAEA